MIEVYPNYQIHKYYHKNRIPDEFEIDVYSSIHGELRTMFSNTSFMYLELKYQLQSSYQSMKLTFVPIR